MAKAFLDIVEGRPIGEVDSTALAETAWVGFCRLLPSGVFPSLSHSNVDGVMIIAHMRGKTSLLAR